MHAQKLAPLPNFQEDWVRDQEPFRIAGNLYYVGSYDLACYLITTRVGHILINTGLPGSDTMIRRHVEALGFRWRDIRILLATHAHFDHVGAMAAVQKQTGARLMIEEADAPLLADGGNSDFNFGGKGPIFEPARVDRLLYDRDKVALGEMILTVLHHPGHTKGACSYLFTVRDSARAYRVLIANMPSILDETKFPGMPAYPNVQKDYAHTFRVMPGISFDIWLSSHAGQFDLHSKWKEGYHPDAFIDRKGYDAALAKLKTAYDKKCQSGGNPGVGKIR
ncbi:metallo-beta-lactamase class B [Dinghuibacter silviterrae]|uniref:Metallo-beta-lactamase class B n=1 Tax=Dinghuibacter silviterrae TaxID=1539049 RepID=A0A4R8DGK5_9BACT|nr:metallo-beta-lactamase class B [Dinghuibacter silviterrae]